ncbi:Cof-type HAD-IIB family hydrolase [Selenomonas sp. TAMA-11512]|uniref:HAD family hydrolase n=1 Tax=Selenomonas sp. TAMA-11512 TaxID=3095337 RepID=UPI0030881830|nr:Cof-type HAD-IIB family hydrolase [Selenomonas sp. TAMA-11512]
MAKIKYIFSDLDGTLLDAEGQLPADLGDLLADLDERGVKFIPSSGRQYAALRCQFAEWADHLTFLAENGSLVMSNNAEVFARTMPRETADEILTYADRNPLAHSVYCGKRMAYVKSRDEVFFAEMRKYFTQFEIVDDFREATDECLKISVCEPLHANAEKNIYPDFERFAKGLQVIVASDYWLDVMVPGSNKGAAVRTLQEKWGIRPEECLAFGDYLNDVEMFEAVGTSYAMENAHPLLKEHATDIAPLHTENGVIETIRELMKEGRI